MQHPQNKTDMNLYTLFMSQLLLPVHERVNRYDAVAMRYQMKGSQLWCTDQINVSQLSWFGARINIEVELVGKISAEKYGKIRYIVSHA